MFRFLSSLVILLASAGSAAAGLDAAEEAALKGQASTIRSAVLDADFAAVEAELANAQGEYLRTGGNPDYLRGLMTLFYVNNPLVLDFTEQWVRIYPESAFAHSARVWALHRLSWDIRGGGVARRIHRDSRIEFGRLQEEAWDHAKSSYDLDPRFIPASDGVIRLASAAFSRSKGYKVLREVMESDPNMGTLERALGMTAPGWGPLGTWEKSAEICEFYGPMIEDFETDPVIHCKIFAAESYHPNEERRDWVDSHIMTGSFPDLEYLMMLRYTGHLATRAQAEVAWEYLNREGVTEPEYAHEFDFNLAMRYGFDFVSKEHQQRARKMALEALEWDPYNPELIVILQEGVSEFVRVGDSFEVRAIHEEDPTHEERIEYARRLFVVSPYNPKNWHNYRQMRFVRSPKNLLLDEPYWVNAVYYADHSPDALFSYAFGKWRVLAHLEQLESYLELPQIKSMSQEMQTQARAAVQIWLDARDTVDLDKDLRCPMMRAYRLFQHLCKTSKDEACETYDERVEMFELVQADVNKRRVCSGIMGALPRELFFTPVPADLSVPEG